MIITRYRIPVAALILLFSCAAFGQLKVVPIPKTSFTSKSNKSSKLTTAVLSLPVWDDFSTSFNVPDTGIWVNSSNVRINDGQGLNSPSLNVATFDGLDANGNPYSLDQSAVGITDSLVSKPIDLSLVPANLQNTVYLSFFYQKAGNGELPDDDDLIQLEFLTPSSGWIQVWPENPATLSNDVTSFTQEIVQVHDSLLHDSFQFRFVAIGRQSGPFDSWNIDYIYLDMARDNQDFDYLDRSIIAPPNSIFKGLTSVPIDHLDNADTLLADSTYIEVFNHEALSVVVTTVGFNVNITDEASGNQVGSLDVPGDAKIISSKGTITLSADPPDFNLIQTAVDNGEDSLALKFDYFIQSFDTLIDRIDPVTQDTTYFNTYNYKSNDTISRSYLLKDYYAYDDGSAEFGAGLKSPGNRIAYEFRTFKKDTLVEVLMHFPNIGSQVAGTPITLFILKDTLDSEESEIHRQTVTIQANNIDELKSYALTPAIVVDTTFYIGYRQTTDGFLPIGLDRNTDSSNKIFLNIGGGWVPSEEVTGSLMIRPKFGSAIITSVEDEIPSLSRLRIYPNPAPDGRLTIEGHFDDIECTDLIGRNIPLRMRKESDLTIVELENVKTGLYLLRTFKDKKIQTHKILID